LNYRANIVIFHEIVPLSAHTSKKEEAKSGTSAREMAKTDRKTGGIRGCSSWHLLFRSPPHRKAPKVRRRSGSERRAPRAQRRNRAAQSPSSPGACWVNAVPTEKGGAHGSNLGHFSNLSGSFPPIAPTRGRPPRCRKKRGRRNRRKISLARTSPSFGFLPSPTCSNSVEHNALGVKTSRILTHSKQPATHSESTSCG